MTSSQRLVRLTAEVASVKKHPSPGIHMYWEDESKLDEITVQMTGPDDSPYANGTFILKVNVPERYPFVPPSVVFQTPVYHPNIDPNGRICLQALKPKPSGTWNVTLNLITVLASIRILLKEPNLADPLMTEIAKEYSDDYAGYIKKATNFTQVHAASKKV